MAKKVVKDMNYRQKTKLKTKLLRASKKGKLKRHQKETLRAINDQHHAKGQKIYKELIEDYEHVREHKRKEDDAEFEEMEAELTNGKQDSEDEVKEEVVEDEEMDTDSEIASDADVDEKHGVADGDSDNDINVDLLDDDEEYTNQFIDVKDEMQSEDEGELRHFKTDLAKNEKLMLPIKVDGKVVQRIRKLEEADDESEGPKLLDKKVKKGNEDYSSLSASELIAKRRELLDNTKDSIANLSIALSADPQQNISNLKTLIDIVGGKNVHSLIFVSIKKLTMASLAKVFADIAPGYYIRKKSESELKQKMQKQTKELVNFEDGLMSNYLKFLQILEKDVKYFTDSKQKKFDETSDRFKFGVVAGKVMGQLAVKLPHFNYATNILTCLIRLATCNYQPLVEEACSSISAVLKNDMDFKISLHVAKSVAQLVAKKNTVLNVDLLTSFLSLNIREVDKGQAQKEKKALEIRKSQILKEKRSKSEAKFKHQMRQMEHDLKKLEASESHAMKLKYATDTMKQVFLVYFRIIRRLPTTKLLGPVLTGLSKYAHLVNIEFFDDLITSLEALLEMQHLSVINALNSVKTVFTILSGEGQLLNIDPFKFYKCIFGFIPAIPFEKDEQVRGEQVKTLVQCMDLMLVRRKKQVSIARVAAFAKRLLAISFMLPAKECAAIVAELRSMFMTHQGLAGLVEVEEEIVMNGIYHPDVIDPDTCNALASSAIKDFQMLLRYRHQMVVQYADNILSGCQSTGPKRLRMEWVTMKPYEWVDSDVIKTNIPSPFVELIFKAAHKRKLSLCSKNLCSTVEYWLNNNSSSS